METNFLTEMQFLVQRTTKSQSVGLYVFLYRLAELYITVVGSWKLKATALPDFQRAFTE